MLFLFVCFYISLFAVCFFLFLFFLSVCCFIADKFGNQSIVHKEISISIFKSPAKSRLAHCSVPVRTVAGILQ